MQPALPKLPLSPCDVSAARAGHRKAKSNNGSQRRASLISRGPPLPRQDLGRLRERIVDAVFLKNPLLRAVGSENVEGVEHGLAEFGVALGVSDRNLEIGLDHEAALEAGLVL